MDATDEPQRAHDLARMKRTATGLLVVATVVFVVARVLEDRHPWVGYVRATAEAAMVGAVADWFAVTALFRHPLGLPIPHTAIIPTQKDSIGKGLGTFVQQNFLTREVVEEKLADTPIATRLGGWLAEPANAAKVGEQASTVVASVLDALRDDEVQDAIEGAIATKVRATPAGPILGRGLGVAIADDRHQQVFSIVLRKVGESLEANRQDLRVRLARESPWWVPDNVDDRIFSKLFDGVQHLLADVAANPDHELRGYFDERVRQLVEDLDHDPAMQARADELKEELLAHPAVRDWSAGVWADLKEGLIRRSADPESHLRGRIEAGVVTFGERLRDDASLQAKVDDWIRSAVAQLVEQSQGEVGELIASTVARWDPDESSKRIELAVGRDLQFIRINGTVVGGLVGLAIYTVGQLFT